MTIFEKRVVSGLDDVEQAASGKMSLTSSDLELSTDGNTVQTVGIRFTSIDIPQGAIITSAYLQFQTDEVGSSATSLLIRGEDVDEAAAFANVTNNVSLRTKTDAAASWSPAAWTTVGQAQRTPDLSAVVQEIVSRAGWSALHDMAFIITGTGTRTAEAFESGAASAPLLHIEYVMPTGSNAAPTLDLDASATGAGYAATFTENAGGVAIADFDVLIADADDVNMERATLTLTNAQAGDQLLVNALPAGITVSSASTATTVILTGSATIADYQTALRQVSFNSTSETPATTARLINVTVNDGIVDSNIAVATIAIDRAPDALGDIATTVKNTAVTTGNVLLNDDPGDAPATITAFAAVSTSGGTVVNNGNGTFTYTPAVGFTGADTFGYTIADADGDTSSATVAVTVTSSAPTIFEKRVVSGLDDVEQAASGAMSLTSSDLELSTDGNTVQTVGIRFTSIDIPQGAIITSAYLQFQTDEVGSSATSLLIRGEDVDEAAAFANVTNNVSLRTKTDAAASWSPAAWTTVGQAGLAQRTPDLSAVVQEIVSRAGWSALHDMAFIITGTGTRTAEAFESGAASAPLLHIEYVMPGPASDPVVGSISIGDVSISEGNSGTKTATFTVSHTGTAAFTVDYATADGTATTADSDYVAKPGTLNFLANQTSQNVTVTINGDTTIEPNETFFVNLTNASDGTILDGVGQGTITNDDPAPVVGSISIGDVSISEGNSGTKTATFTVSHTGTAAFTVDYATADGTATTADSDYVAKSGTLNFLANQTSQNVTVTINGDTAFETDETFFVNLTNASGTILDSVGQGTITNDDPAPVVGSISIGDVSISEGNSGTKTATFTVSHTGTAAFTVNYATADDTATTADSDYVAKSGTLNFLANQTSQDVTVTINGDTTTEPNETFFVNLTNASGTILDGVGQGTITNDDGAPPALNVHVLHVYDTTQYKAGDPSGYGSGDPSGLAYVPSMNTLFIADSEHDESPYFSSVNLFAIRPDGTQINSYSLRSFTREPTGLAYNPINGLLYITDDDARKVFWVDPAYPSVKLGEFSVSALGITDAEDPKIDPVTGNIYMLSGATHTFFELTPTGALVRSFGLPSAITDAEGLAYDAQHDVFFIASGATRGAIFELDGDGNLLATNTTLNSYLNPNGNSKPKIKGLELALSSDPNDGNHLSLYAADYGSDQQNDGRVFEIDLGPDWLIA